MTLRDLPKYGLAQRFHAFPVARTFWTGAATTKRQYYQCFSWYLSGGRISLVAAAAQSMPYTMVSQVFHGFAESPESSIFHGLEHVSRPDPFLGNPGTVRAINLECKFAWFARSDGCGTSEKSTRLVKYSIKWPPEHTFRCVPSSGSVVTARPINLEAENIRFGENCTGGNKFQKLNLREPCSSHRFLDESEENTFSDMFARVAFRSNHMNLPSRLIAHMLTQFSENGTHRNVCSSY